MPNGHIEWHCEHCGTLRVGGALGEPYTWAVTIVKNGPASVMVVGLSKQPPTASEWREAKRIVKHAGITAYRFLRLNGAKVRMRARTA